MLKTLNKNFRPLFWGYNFDSINLLKDKRIIIVNSLNYGSLDHWRELVKIYGRENLKKSIELIPKSEFRKQVIKIIKLLFKINKFKYVSRSAQIKAERGIR
jgi:hypothetical protein